jgi:hypothetical protein
MPRPKANSNFFKTWSADMAYVLGFVVTDGCLVEHDNGYNTLNITNKYKYILKDMLRVMGSNHKISVKPRGGVPNLLYFQMQIRDKSIYTDLLNLGITPRKSKTIRAPSVPSEFFGDFVRGCFDGDGSVIVWRDPRWKHSWQMRTVFTSGSWDFLKDLQKRLHKEFELSNGSMQDFGRAYSLCYSIADSIKLYQFMYRETCNNFLHLKYKLKKFKFFKKIRPDCFKN